MVISKKTMERLVDSEDAIKITESNEAFQTEESRIAAMRKNTKTHDEDEQHDFLVEECAALVVAVQHCKRRRIDYSVVVEKMAHVSLMTDILLQRAEDSGLVGATQKFQLVKDTTLLRIAELPSDKE